jgi:hypothetical protein
MGKAIQLEKARVVAGRIIPVYNKKRKSAANKSYYSVWVEDADGKNERCILLTEYQIKTAEERARKNPEDCTQKGFITDLLD